ncbi:MAG: DNA polymerase III subunit beta [Chloroflexota bacterium]|nr:DNA polymerase III subunit beta [Chloroflexota bacterium]
MKVSCLQEDLQRALGRVSRAVATRTTMPVLSNVWIGSDDSRLKIAATNMEIGVTTRIDANVEEEGTITVDARLLAEFVNTLPSGQVDLDLDPKRLSLTVRAGRDKAAINGLDAQDFPVISTIKDDDFSVRIDGQLFRERISLVEFAAATDESRPVLAGVLTRFEGEVMVLASADGFRMAVAEGPMTSADGSPVAPIEERLDVIVPARSYRELARLIGDHDGDVTLSVTAQQRQILARFGDTEWVSQLIDGTFPDVKQIIPKEFSTRVDVGRDALLNAVRRASYFARENNDVIRFAIHTGADEMTPGSVEVTANAAERGNSESFVDASISGGELQIAFNSRYLADVLGVLKHGNVMLGMNGANQAGVVRPSGGDSYSHVIMPMVIGGQ